MAKERVADVNRTHARIRVTQAEKNGQAVDPAVRAIAKAKPRIA